VAVAVARAVQMVVTELLEVLEPLVLVVLMEVVVV
jgi:hypothetical protein